MYVCTHSFAFMLVMEVTKALYLLTCTTHRQNELDFSMSSCWSALAALLWSWLVSEPTLATPWLCPQYKTWT